MAVNRIGVSFICPSCKYEGNFWCHVFVETPEDLIYCITTVCPECLEVISPKDVRSVKCESDLHFSISSGGLY